MAFLHGLGQMRPDSVPESCRLNWVKRTFVDGRLNKVVVLDNFMATHFIHLSVAQVVCVSEQTMFSYMCILTEHLLLSLAIENKSML